MLDVPTETLRAREERLARAMRDLRIREERKRQSDLGARGRPGGLLHFVRYFWHILEPNTPLVVDMPMEAMCLHLEAVTRGEIKRLLINVSPGESKSLLVNVFWPAWEWSGADQPHQRYITFAYASHLTERDNGRFRDILRAPAFTDMWGHKFTLTSDGVIKPTNDKRGWKFASSIDGVGTGERAGKVLCDDIHSIREAESEKIRSGTVQWVREGMSNRLNDMAEGVIVMIGQRVHEEDASGTLLKEDLGYIHLCIPNEFDPGRKCVTEWWSDPREEYGELASPIRFSPKVVAQIKRTLGPHAYASQYQQAPEPRGGGILKRDWWGAYELPVGAPFRHTFDFILASLDPAYTARAENDPSGFIVFGCYRDKGQPKVVLLHAWKKWLELHGKTMEHLPGETNKDYVRRTSKDWGLVEWVAHDCTRLRVHTLLVEDKASGHSVVQEFQRLYSGREWGVRLQKVGALDKRARAYAIQAVLADGIVEAPASPDGDVLIYREWAQMVIDECAKFRGLPGDEDNLVDAFTQGIKFLRDQGLLLRGDERAAQEQAQSTRRANSAREPIYPV